MYQGETDPHSSTNNRRTDGDRQTDTQMTTYTHIKGGISLYRVCVCVCVCVCLTSLEVAIDNSYVMNVREAVV